MIRVYLNSIRIVPLLLALFSRYKTSISAQRNSAGNVMSVVNSYETYSVTTRTQLGRPAVILRMKLKFKYDRRLKCVRYLPDFYLWTLTCDGTYSQLSKCFEIDFF